MEEDNLFYSSQLLSEQDEAIIFEAFFDDIATPNQTTPEADALLNALSSVELEIGILYYAIEKTMYESRHRLRKDTQLDLHLV